MYKLLKELYDNEVSYTHLLYDDIGLAEDVLNYVKYNGNKALSNLDSNHILKNVNSIQLLKML